MATITFICVFNNKHQLNDMLISSLNNIKWEEVNTLLIDNSAMLYTSASHAFNNEIEKNLNDLGDVFVFTHQDIAFDNADFLYRIVDELQQNPLQILGFAGMSVSGKTQSNLKYYHTKRYITSTQIAAKTKVYSLDECCFAMTKDLYQNLRFDEKTCNHWHLYAVDMCYNAKNKFNIDSYVLPEVIYHKYDGSTGLYGDYHFLLTMLKMIKKYQHHFDTIYTPCYVVKTKWNKAIPKLIRSEIKNIVRNLMHL